MVKTGKVKGIITLVMAAMLVFTGACGNSGTNSKNGATSGNSATTTPTENSVKLTGEIKVDGSSTVFPLTEAAAEEFRAEQPDVRVPVGVSGTGGGFKQFCAGEIAIADASRPIKEEEAAACTTNGVSFKELSVAYDGLSVVVSKENDFIDHLTVDELNKIFKTGSTVKTWNEVRDTWPAEPIVMFSPGADSGTYDYFNEAILHKEGIRNDTDTITFSEDDNSLVVGISGSKYGIGYFGFAYYEENQDKLKLVPIDGGKGPVSPTYDTIKDGTYAPLSRPLYIYVSDKELERKEVKEFVNFYINNIGKMAGEVGYVSLPDEKYKEEAAKIQ
ncbi:PstS family phosphate ABC transporter substrate-binding protein [Paenibacillus sp. L3-i20]|uniref:PstS family phosphate ABC transporter substrate-binding protein n=1 Tax=Paenibacillus sp. L3-i20 TaxID=2905833 RepID=UPI00207E151F|nr:phosphate ABC transporter substrate-binding protein [Paenibacillus sp. L3-i20]